MIFKLVENINFNKLLFEDSPSVDYIYDDNDKGNNDIFREVGDKAWSTISSNTDYESFIEYLNRMANDGLTIGYDEHLFYIINSIDSKELSYKDLDKGSIFQDVSLFTNNKNINDFIYVIEAYKILSNPTQLKRYFTDFMPEYSSESDKSMYLMRHGKVKYANEIREMLDEWTEYQKNIDNPRNPTTDSLLYKLSEFTGLPSSYLLNTKNNNLAQEIYNEATSKIQNYLSSVKSEDSYNLYTDMTETIKDAIANKLWPKILYTKYDSRIDSTFDSVKKLSDYMRKQLNNIKK